MSAILDTCVVSELYDVNAEPAVVQRVNELGADAYLSVITIGELFRGTQLLEPGRRQRALFQSLRRTEQRFAQRILPIDTRRRRDDLDVHVTKMGEVIRLSGGSLHARDAIRFAPAPRAAHASLRPGPEPVPAGVPSHGFAPTYSQGDC